MPISRGQEARKLGSKISKGKVKYMAATKNHLPAIIFDFGGVLLEWDPRRLYRKFFNGDDEAMESFLAEIDFHEWNMKQDAGRPFAEAVSELSAQFPQYADLIQAYDERWEESLVGPIEGSIEILEALKDAGYLLYGLSNWSDEKYQLVRHKYSFFDWFKDIVISGAVQLVKPDPLIYTLALKRFGRPAQECLLIDDTVQNIATAHELGFQTILFHSPEQLRNALPPAVQASIAPRQ